MKLSIDPTLLATSSTSARLRFAGILQSEFWKLRSVRSTYWTLLVAVVANVGMAVLGAIFFPDHLKQETFDATRFSLVGIHLSQIAFAILGVIVITSEYDTGTIRSSLAAVPQRFTLFASKALVFAALALVVGLLSSFAAYFSFQLFLSDSSLRSSLGDPGVLRGVVGGALYLTVLGLFGLGLGAILRRSAPAIAAVFVVLFVPPFLLEVLPGSWFEAISPYVPLEAGSQIYALRHDGGALGAWQGFAVFCLYAAAALAAGCLLMRRRDA